MKLSLFSLLLSLNTYNKANIFRTVFLVVRFHHGKQIFNSFIMHYFFAFIILIVAVPIFLVATHEDKTI